MITEQNVMKHKKYKILMDVFWRFQHIDIRRMYLHDKLVKNFKSDTTEKNPLTHYNELMRKTKKKFKLKTTPIEKSKKRLKKQLKSGQISKSTYKKALSNASKTHNYAKYLDITSHRDKPFDTKDSINKHIQRLITLNLIESYNPVSGGQSCLQLTEKGMIVYLKHDLIKDIEKTYHLIKEIQKINDLETLSLLNECITPPERINTCITDPEKIHRFLKDEYNKEILLLKKHLHDSKREK